jgi:hypothetical protein
MFIVVEARIDVRLSKLETRASSLQHRASGFDTSIVSVNLFYNVTDTVICVAL